MHVSFCMSVVELGGLLISSFLLAAVDDDDDDDDDDNCCGDNCSYDPTNNCRNVDSGLYSVRYVYNNVRS